jgi:sarcosine/dimethylglycine N-methyltransferase
MRSSRPVSARSFGKTTRRPAKPGLRSCALRGHRLSPNLGVVMGPDFAPLAMNLGRNLMEGRVGILTAVFEAVSTKT